MNLTQDIIAQVRNYRAEEKVPASQQIEATVVVDGPSEQVQTATAASFHDAISSEASIIKSLARISDLTVLQSLQRPPLARTPLNTRSSVPEAPKPTATPAPVSGCLWQRVPKAKTAPSWRRNSTTSSSRSTASQANSATKSSAPRPPPRCANAWKTSSRPTSPAKSS